MLETLGRNRDNAASERTPLVYAGTAIHPYIDEMNALTLKVTNNSVVSAEIIVDLYYGLDT